MDRDPSGRFPSLRALARALREQGTVGVGARQSPARTPAGRTSQTPPASAPPAAGVGRAAEASATVQSGKLNRPSGSRASPSRNAAPPSPAVPTPLAPTEPFHEVILLEPRIVLVRRSGRRFEDATQVAEERRRIGAALDKLGRQRKRLLVDSRRAPLSFDDRLATAFMALREEIGRDFERTAVVVDTKIGILQANRLNRETTVDGALAAFESESEALAFLTK